MGLAIVASFRLCVAEQYLVESGSMKPTLVTGDYLLVSKLSYGVRIPFVGWWPVRWARPQRGDVVVFRGEDGQTWVKRVVAEAGDKVAIKDGRVVVGGTPVERESLGSFENWQDAGRVLPLKQLRAERYKEKLGDRWHLYQTFGDTPDADEVTVGPHEVFVLGDNRDDSIDSRKFGTLDIDRIVGRPLWIWWSFGHRDHGRKWLVGVE